MRGFGADDAGFGLLGGVLEGLYLEGEVGGREWETDSFGDCLVFFEGLGVGSWGSVVEGFGLAGSVGVGEECDYPRSWDLEHVRSASMGTSLKRVVLLRR